MLPRCFRSQFWAYLESLVLWRAPKARRSFPRHLSECSEDRTQLYKNVRLSRKFSLQGPTWTRTFRSTSTILGELGSRMAFRVRTVKLFRFKRERCLFVYERISNQCNDVRLPQR